MHRRSAAHSTHILLKMAVEEVQRLSVNHPELDIQNHELLISSFLQSATQIYLYEKSKEESSDEKHGIADVSGSFNQD
jgi:hypothetical protein